MDDDLLLTNKYLAPSDNKQSDTNIFNKLMNAKEKAKTNYSKNNPEFTENIQTNRETGISVNENSIAFEQFLKFAQTDKKKKLKKTILNIDSRNRTNTYTYDSLHINYSSNNSLEFTSNTSTFIINTGSTINYINDITIFKQIILTKLSDVDFDQVGVKKINFEFDIHKGSPILIY